MQYMLMCCFDEKRWEEIPESQRDAIMQEYGEFVQSLVNSGHLRDWREATVELDRHHDSRQECQAYHHRRTFRRNKGTARRLPPDRVQRPRRGDFNRETHSDDSLWRDDRGASSACHGMRRG